jgi:hypothetical protein
MSTTCHERLIVLAVAFACVSTALLLCTVDCRAEFKTDLVAFGDISYRSTNLLREGYDFLGGWGEARVAFRGLCWMDPFLGLAPYVRAPLAWSNHPDVARENTFIYGVGIESGILKRLSSLSERSWTEWLRDVRLYAEYMRLHYTGEKSDRWSPDYDWRVGAEVWKEFNIDPPTAHQPARPLCDKLWGELWADCGYRETGFLLDEYRSWCADAVLRAGYQERWYFMPYATARVKVSQWFPVYWENRAVLGVGLRLMPFTRSQSEWLRGLRFYAEYTSVAGYFRKEPCGVPEEDTIVGLIFSYGWWGG